MDDSAGLLAEFDAAATAALVEPDVLLDRLAARLSGVLVPPRAAVAGQQSSPPRGGPGRAAIAPAVPWGRPPIVTMSMDETVAELQSDARLVGLLLDHGGLQSVEIDGRLHIPEWQFDPSSPTRLLRGLGMILTAAEGRLHWTDLAMFMVTPHAALSAEGPRSIVEWLHDDLPLQPVLDIVRSCRDAS